MADYANSEPAAVRFGRVKKAVANAVQQEVKSLCGLEASQVPAEECLSRVGEPCDVMDNSDELDGQEESTHERAVSRKKKSKRHKEDPDETGGEELYRRHYTLDASLPLRLRPEFMEKLRCLRACVIRSLYHIYEPFAARISKNPAIPDSTLSTLKNSECLLFWCRKIVENRQEPMWEFNFKFKKQYPRLKSKCMDRLPPSIQYEDVHTNPDQDCCLLHLYSYCHRDDIYLVYY